MLTIYIISIIVSIIFMLLSEHKITGYVSIGMFIFAIFYALIPVINIISSIYAMVAWSAEANHAWIKKKLF